MRLRTKVTKGPGSRAAGLAMAFKLIEAAQDRWRAVNGPHLVALVRAGATFEKGVLIENQPAGSGSRRVINDETRSTGLDDSSATCAAARTDPACGTHGARRPPETPGLVAVVDAECDGDDARERTRR